MTHPTTATQPAINLRDVVKHFGIRRALNHLTFDVRRGETVVLWGPNGAGKTTALRCMLGILPFDGTITVLGHDVRRQGREVRRLIGYVPQELGLHAEQTVEETVSFYARIRRIAGARAASLLEAWHLREAAHVPVRALSGGMKQRAALVIALLADPPILLLD